MAPRRPGWHSLSVSSLTLGAEIDTVRQTSLTRKDIAMANTWQLQRAKAELSKLIDTSAKEGPQTVTRHGRPAAVVVSAADYQRLARRRGDFKEFLRRAPLYQLKLERSRDTGRPVTL